MSLSYFRGPGKVKTKVARCLSPRIEELFDLFRGQYTIVMATHNMQQAARVSDYTAFLYLGELIEFDETSKIFTNPGQKATEDYITGRYG